MKHIPELDGLRAVAALAVVTFHAAIDGPFRGGFLGVDVFFVLSGFLITSLLSEEWKGTEALNLRRFYWRRFLRLMPPLLFLLGAYLAVAPLLRPDYPHARDALLAALYVSDYSFPFTGNPYYLQHTWSLAVEEQFYLLWPILLVPLIKSKRPLLLLSLVYVAELIWRARFAGDWQSYYYRFDTHSTGLILGAMLYFALSRLRTNEKIAWLSLGTIYALCFIGKAGGAIYFIPMVEVAAAALIACIATGGIGSVAPLLNNRPMIWLGKLSYGIYLWQGPVALMVPEIGFLPRLLIILPASIGLAALSYYSVEAWARQIRMSARLTTA